jgi:hypothetical protein
MYSKATINSVVAVWLLAITTTTTTITSTLAFTPSSRFGIVSQQRPTTTASKTILKEQQQQQDGGGKSGGFSLSNLFGGSKEGAAEDAASATATLRGSKKLEPHPSVRKHISPLNRLGPDPQVQPKSDPLPIHPDVRSGTLPNGLPYVILPNKSPPGRFEAHLQVFSGSGTEGRDLLRICFVCLFCFSGPRHPKQSLIHRSISFFFQLTNWNHNKE